MSLGGGEHSVVFLTLLGVGIDNIGILRAYAISRPRRTWDEGSGRNVIPKYALSGQRKGQEMTEAVATELPTHGVNLTEVAQNKVRTLLEQEGRTDLRLRIAVQPGGCSGLIYQLYFDERVLDGDAVRDYEGVQVIVDKMSAPYLDGSTIDFEDTIEKQGFSIDNPNAAGSCACGDSFH